MDITTKPIETTVPQPSNVPIKYDVLQTVDNAKFDKVDMIISEDINLGFPGAVVLIAQHDKILFLKSYGYLQKYDRNATLNTPIDMDVNTYFDLASLTKVYATDLAIMKLVDEGRITVDDYVYKHLPDFNKENYRDITIRHLLTHTSGLDSEVKFFREDVEEGISFYTRNRDKTISLLSNAPLINPVGTKTQYSDTGYMILGALIESVTGLRQDVYIEEYIYKPLNIQDYLTYRPLDNNVNQDNIAATERMGNTRDGNVYFDGIRLHTLQGEVHDEKAFYSMNSISGHAGLFGNAYAINTLNQVFLNSGTYGETSVFSKETLDYFLATNLDNPYQLLMRRTNTFYTLKDLPNDVLSHTGWTGTFSLIDPSKDLSIIILTSKRHSIFSDDDFESASYDTGKYYPIVKLIYECLE